MGSDSDMYPSTYDIVFDVEVDEGSPLIYNVSILNTDTGTLYATVNQFPPLIYTANEVYPF